MIATNWLSTWIMASTIFYDPYYLTHLPYYYGKGSLYLLHNVMSPEEEKKTLHSRLFSFSFFFSFLSFFFRLFLSTPPVLIFSGRKERKEKKIERTEKGKGKEEIYRSKCVGWIAGAIRAHSNKSRRPLLRWLLRRRLRCAGE